MKNRVGVILSGCGVYDGAEIHESVLTLLALCRAGANIKMIAPNKDQMHVINHLTGEPTSETRNVLVESARIARGDISDIADISCEQLDALAIPGGFGAAKNLSNFAVKGVDCEVDPDVARLIAEMHQASKPIVAICIAPAIVVKGLAICGVNAEVTIGTDKGTADSIEKMGGKHIEKDVRGVAVDKVNKVITTPAYMLGQNIAEVADGIDNAIAELMKMLK